MPAVPYKTSDYLKTPEAIAEYLNVVLEDPDSDHEDLLIALRNVAEAVGGVSELSRRTGFEPSWFVACSVDQKHPKDRHRP